ncbi:MAG: septal ring lytic transglycosylase RlpA family protein [Bacteroidota bacterium]
MLKLMKYLLVIILLPLFLIHNSPASATRRKKAKTHKTHKKAHSVKVSASGKSRKNTNTVNRRHKNTSVKHRGRHSRKHHIRCRLQAYSGTENFGVCTYYHPMFHGRRTASGERYNQNIMTAAHRDLPFGTYVKLRNPATGGEVIVKINDRGPFAARVLVDVSYAAAKKLGLPKLGPQKVEMTVLGKTLLGPVEDHLLADTAVPLKDSCTAVLLPFAEPAIR